MQSVMTPTGACRLKSLDSSLGHLLKTLLVGFYAGLNLIAWFMVFCFVRETKQLTLEELDRKQNLAPLRAIHLVLTSHIEVFSVPTKKYISHELTVWLPYFIKRHILRRNVIKPPQIIEKEENAEKVLDY